MPLSISSTAIVSENNDLDRHLVLLHSSKFHHRHLETAVAAHRYDLPVRSRELGAKRRGNGISHSTHTAARQEPAVFLDDAVRAGPELVLPHVGDVDSVVLHGSGQALYKDLRVDRKGVDLFLGQSRGIHVALSAGRVLCIVLVTVELVDPQRVIRYDLRLIELLKNMFDITDQRDRGTGVLADLRGVDVNMHQNFMIRSGWLKDLSATLAPTMMIMSASFMALLP